MLKKSTKFCIEWIGAILAGMVVLTALFGARLYWSPIPLNFLNDVIAQSLSGNSSDLAIRVEQTELVWDGDHHAVVLRAGSLRIFDREDRLLATMPDLAIGLSLRALFYGQIAASTITVYRPSLTVIRDAGGAFTFAPKESGAMPADSPPVGTDQFIRDMLAALADSTGQTGKLGFLRRFKIDNADVIYDDRKNGVTFWVPMVDLDLKRDSDGLYGRANLRLELNEKITAIAADLSWPIGQTDMTIISNFENIDFTSMVELVPELRDMAFLRLPISGKLRLSGNPQIGISGVRVIANGGAGTIVSPDLWPDPVPIDSAELDVEYDRLGNITLHQFAVKSGNTNAIATGKVENLADRFGISADLRLANIAAGDLGRYWPVKAAINARDWVVPNIKDGQVIEAKAQISAHAKSNDFSDLAIDDLKGTMQASGITVDYFNPLPLATGIDASIEFNADQFIIHSQGGTAGGVSLGKGEIVIDGLSAVDQTISIGLQTSGKLTKALEIVDHKPLQLPSRRDINPANVRGDFVADLSFKFPLLKDLRLEQLDISVAGQMKNAFMHNALWGFPLSRGDMKIKLTQNEMEIGGEAFIGGIAASVLWQEDFRTPPESARSRYLVKADLPSVAADMFGLPKPVNWDGTADMNVEYLIMDKSNRQLTIQADLQNCALAIPEINYFKEAGAPLTGRLDITMDGESIRRISAIQLKSDSVAISGDADFDVGNILAKLNLPVVKTGNNDLRLTMRRAQNNDYDVAIGGKLYDLTHLKRKRRSAQSGKNNYAIDLALAELALGGTSNIRDANGRVIWRNDDFESVRFSGKLEASEKSDALVPLDIAVTPTPGGRKVAVKSDDAGAALRALDIYDTMIGGQLAVDGVYDDRQKQKPLAGNISILNFRLKQAPVLAQLLNLSSLSGILENLSGQGIGFDKLMTDFELTGGILKIKQARVNGSSIGLKSSGTMDLNNSYYDLDGILIPANGINKILSNIPLVGTILTAGGEQPLLAFNYRIKGPLAAPNVSVNPLSALTPGILREVFDNKTE